MLLQPRPVWTRASPAVVAKQAPGYLEQGCQKDRRARALALHAEYIAVLRLLRYVLVEGVPWLMLQLGHAP